MNHLRAYGAHISAVHLLNASGHRHAAFHILTRMVRSLSYFSSNDECTRYKVFSKISDKTPSF